MIILYLVVVYFSYLFLIEILDVINSRNERYARIELEKVRLEAQRLELQKTPKEDAPAPIEEPKQEPTTNVKEEEDESIPLYRDPHRPQTKSD